MKRCRSLAAGLRRDTLLASAARWLAHRQQQRRGDRTDLLKHLVDAKALAVAIATPRGAA